VFAHCQQPNPDANQHSLHLSFHHLIPVLYHLVMPKARFITFYEIAPLCTDNRGSTIALTLLFIHQPFCI
jgi:hypothetical protein